MARQDCSGADTGIITCGGPLLPWWLSKPVLSSLGRSRDRCEGIMPGHPELGDWPVNISTVGEPASTALPLEALNRGVVDTVNEISASRTDAQRVRRRCRWLSPPGVTGCHPAKGGVRKKRMHQPPAGRSEPERASGLRKAQ